MNKDLRPRRKGFFARWFGPCFDNIASQLKTLCHILYWILLICSIVFGVVTIVAGLISVSMPYTLLYVLGGILLILISPLWVKLFCFSLYGLYGFAEIMDNCSAMTQELQAIHRLLRDMDSAPRTPSAPPPAPQPSPYARPYAAEAQPQYDAYAHQPQTAENAYEPQPGAEQAYSRRRTPRTNL